MGIRDIALLTIGLLGVLFLFDALRPRSPEQFRKRGEVKKRLRGGAVALGLGFVASAFGVVLELENVGPIVGMLALGGLGAGVLASGIVFSRRTFFIRPTGWTEVDGYQWWRNIDGLELLFGGLGGPVDRNWDVSRVEVVNRTNDEVVIEGLNLQASGNRYMPESVNGKSCKGVTVARRTKAHVICSWRFRSALGDVYREGATLAVSVRRGGEPCELFIELKPE